MIVCPIGFVADHIEVVWDLDNELAAAGAGGRHRVRPGRDAERRPPLRALVVDLIDEVRLGVPARQSRAESTLCRAYGSVSTGHCVRPACSSG